MKNYKRIIAEKIKNGEQVALYCYGIYASYLLSYLKKFFGIVPTVIIDNDLRKKGTAEYGVAVMPFIEAKEQYENLQYFICSDDFKYTIIGDLLEYGVKPDAIINYVPVEKRKTCLYFYNRLLLVLGSKGNGTQAIGHCNKDSFKSETVSTRIPAGNGDYENLQQLLEQTITDFESGKINTCNTCVMNKEQYMVSSMYQKHYKQVACYQESCADCLSHCIYCCVGGNSAGRSEITMNSLESYSRFLRHVFSLRMIDDDFSCAIDMSERDSDQKIALVTQTLNDAGMVPLVYKINSCFLTYSEHLSKLMQEAMAYVVWSLDAGTRETYKKIKQVDAFETVINNVKRYIAEDAFGGRFIVAKYLIVKGVNDNEKEFDNYLQLVTELGLVYVSLSFDFYAKADENDLKFIQTCYQKIVGRGLYLTYKNDSKVVTEALEMHNILSQ